MSNPTNIGPCPRTGARSAGRTTGTPCATTGRCLVTMAAASGLLSPNAGGYYSVEVSVASTEYRGDGYGPPASSSGRTVPH